jgi:amidophosphoribosyltransferase
MCAIFGLAGAGPVAGDVYRGLVALQHRGANSCGIATHKAGLGFSVQRGAGAVEQVFHAADLARLRGSLGIGHTRYATSGDRNELERDAQPLLASRPSCALAFNGNLAVESLRPALMCNGWDFNTTNDGEVLLYVLCEALARRRPRVENSFAEVFAGQVVPALAEVMERLAGLGAFSAVAILGRLGLLAFRDPHGIRPLSLARTGSPRRWAFASETTAFDFLGGYEQVRDLLPGEVVCIDLEGKLHSAVVARRRRGFCAFEPVYLAGAGSVLAGQQVYQFRQALGRALAEQFAGLRERVDGILPVPDSGTPAALKLAELWGKPCGGLLKRGTIRSFLEPSQQQRERAASSKYVFIRSCIAGKRVAVVDDSIVRGTTMRHLIRSLRALGAVEVHVLATFPPLVHPCRYGIDMPRAADLVAGREGGDIERVRLALGADSLHYLDEQAVRRALAPLGPLCLACVDGDYVAEEESVAAGEPCGIRSQVSGRWSLPLMPVETVGS